MLEILIAIFFAAFVLVALYGHILLAQALLTPDDHRKSPTKGRAFPSSISRWVIPGGADGQARNP